MAGPAVHISGWARTPMGRPMGRLARLSMPTLGAAAIRGAIGQDAADGPAALWLGCQLTAGLGPNPALAVAGAAGLPAGAACRTLVSGRASGLQAVIQGFFEAGVYGTVVAAGAESISGSPLLVPKGRAGSRLGGSPLWDPAAHDAAIAEPGEPDADWSESSHARAAAAPPGCIATVEVPDRKQGPQPVATDELPARAATATATAPLADGAAAVVIRSGEGVSGPRIVAGVPSGEGGGPDAVGAALLEMAGWTAADLATAELPEDAAAIPRATAATLGIERDRVNPYGGALGRGVPPAAGGVIGVVHACAFLTDAGSGRALVIAGSGPHDAAGIAIELG